MAAVVAPRRRPARRSRRRRSSTRSSASPAAASSRRWTARELFAAATPQAFRAAILRRALASGRDATDEAALCEALGIPVAVVPVSRLAFKITTPEDLELAEAILVAPKGRRGHDAASRNRIRRASLRARGGRCAWAASSIPHDAGLEGHSDGDALLHALTDAVLGAAGAGSIGEHFPPTDPTWKGADSAIFLGKAREIAAARGLAIGNVDAVVVAEAPRIAPHAAKIRAQRRRRSWGSTRTP